MGVVLFVAELGSGFGHVRRLLPIAEAAAIAGHRPLFIVPNVGEVAAFVAGAGFELRPAPSAKERAATGAPGKAVARSFADILGGEGFADATRLLAATRAWDRTLAEIRPVAAVSEFSPFFNLAAFGGDLPVLVVGHGFILPPPHLPRFPLLWEGEPIYDEARLLDSVALACAARGRPAPSALPALMAGSAHAVTGLAPLDPYVQSRLQPSVGPPRVEAELGQDEPLMDVFAYLLGDAPSTTHVLRWLAGSGLRGRAYVRRGREEQRRLVAASAIEWLDAPRPIAAVLAESRLVVHHGSMLMAEEALFAGRPQLVAPIYLEHLFTARNLASLAVATVVRAARHADDVTRAVATCINDRKMAVRARRVATRLWEESPPRAELPRQLLAAVLPR